MIKTIVLTFYLDQVGAVQEERNKGVYVFTTTYDKLYELVINHVLKYFDDFRYETPYLTAPTVKKFPLYIFWDLIAKDEFQSGTFRITGAVPDIEVCCGDHWIAIKIDWHESYFRQPEWIFFTLNTDKEPTRFTIPSYYRIAADGTIFNDSERYPLGERPWIEAAMVPHKDYVLGRINNTLRPSKTNPLTRLLRSISPWVRDDAREIKKILESARDVIANNSSG